jgi:hypothetical protein
MHHPYGLTDEEFAAVDQLQEAQTAPPRDDPVWLSLMWMGPRLARPLESSSRNVLSWLRVSE